MNKEVYGYKIFNRDWTCRDKQYSCPGYFEEDVKLKICKQGMHFCTNILDCFLYKPVNVPFDFENNQHGVHIAKVVAVGDVVKYHPNSKCCTNRLIIIKELDVNDLDDLIDVQTCNDRAHTFNKCTYVYYNDLTAQFWLDMYKYFALRKCKPTEWRKKYKIKNYTLPEA